MATFDTWRDAQQRLGWSDAQTKQYRVAPQKPRQQPFNCERTPPPQDVLTYCVHQWRSEGLVRDYVFSDRHKYEYDLAYPVVKFGIECDGWEFHGKHKKDFERDRKKDRLATCEGWRLLRFTAKEIMQDMPMVLATIAHVYRMCQQEHMP